MKRARSGAGEIGMTSARPAMPPRTGTSSVTVDPAADAAAGRDRRTPTTMNAGAIGFTNHVNHFRPARHPAAPAAYVSRTTFEYGTGLTTARISTCLWRSTVA